MKIDRVSTVATRRPSRGERGGAAKTGGFSKALSSGEGAAAASLSGGTGLGRVDALLALQEVTMDPGAERQGWRRGEDLLERLDELRLALLDGRLSVDATERLAALAATHRPQVRDPRLAEILDEIELRAAVELAKLER